MSVPPLPLPADAVTELRRLDRAHLLHPFTHTLDMAARGGTRIITHGQGVWIWDESGKKILDSMAGLWCLHVGYARPELIEAARAQLETLSFYNSFFRSATEPAIRLAAKLVEMAHPIPMQRVFFANSGSEAVETALRVVRRYWDLKGQPEKTVCIGRHYAYHGSTIATVSLGGMPPMQVQGGLPLPDYVQVTEPNHYKLGAGLTPEEFGVIAAQSLEQAISRLGPQHVAAFFAEPVQGAGGVIIPPHTYFPEIQRICRKYDVLLVADEVVSAFGRLGYHYGSHAFGLEPDIITTAKGLTSGYFPLSATLISPRLDDVLIKKGGDFAYGYTYSAHPVGCAVALANLDVMRKERLTDKARHAVGGTLLRKLQARLQNHPIVGEVRGMGMIYAIEIAADPASRTPFGPDRAAGIISRDYILACGAIVRAVGDTLVFAPPLILSDEEADTLVHAIASGLDASATILGY